MRVYQVREHLDSEDIPQGNEQDWQLEVPSRGIAQNQHRQDERASRGQLQSPDKPWAPGGEGLSEDRQLHEKDKEPFEQAFDGSDRMTPHGGS